MRVMSLVDTMLSEEAFMTILESTPASLISLNLSQNEHLTAKCFAYLHKFENLAHLTVEKCNINDKILHILLDPDPMKLNLIPSAKTDEKTNLEKKVIEFDEPEEFQLSGMILTLKLFNASKNRISDIGAFTVAKFIEKSEFLETLLLHWNKIRAKGAIALAKSLK